MGTYRLAVATDDGAHLDTHFGRATRFDIYDVTADEDVVAAYAHRTAEAAAPLLGADGGVANAQDASNDLFVYVCTRLVKSACHGFSHDEERLVKTASVIGDCYGVIVQSLGPGAEAVLTANGILVFVSEKPISEALTSLARYLAAVVEPLNVPN